MKTVAQDLNLQSGGVNLRATELGKLLKGQPCPRSTLLEEPRPSQSWLQWGMPAGGSTVTEGPAGNQLNPAVSPLLFRVISGWRPRGRVTLGA